MDELQERWREAFGRYEDVKAERESQVRRWEWASGQRYDPRPLFFERFGLGRGRVLKAEPANRSGAYLYGFDAENKLVLARRFTYSMDYSQPPLVIALRGLKAVLQWSDQFLWQSELAIETVTYSEFAPRMPVAVTSREVREGRPVSYRSLEIAIGPQIRAKTPQAVWGLVSRTGGPLRQYEDYRYEGGRLVQVDLRLERGLTLPSAYRHTLSYDSRGLAEVTMLMPDGTLQHAYQRVRKGESLPVLAERVADRLLRVIPETLAAAQVASRVYSLVLYYHDRYSPPELVLGLELDRERAAAQGRPEARRMAFLPVAPAVPIRDPDFESHYALFEQQVTRTEGWGVARRMLRRVARELAQRDWRGVLEVTPDFVVFAADYEADDVADAIAASNPESAIATLRANGWL